MDVSIDVSMDISVDVSMDMILAECGQDEIRIQYCAAQNVAARVSATKQHIEQHDTNAEKRLQLKLQGFRFSRHKQSFRSP